MSSDPGEVASPRPWWSCPGAMLLFHAQRTAFGLAVAWPLARWVSGRMGGRPGADATLFDGGGILLAEVLRASRPVAAALTSASLVTAILALVVGHVALAALLDALARREPIGIRARLGAAVAPLPQLLLASVASTILAAAVLAAVWWTGRGFVRSIVDAPVGRDLGVIAVIGLGLAASSSVGLLQDLVSAGIAGRRLGFMAALDLAWTTLRDRPIRLWIHRAVRSAAAGCVLAAAALAAIRIGMRASRDALLAQAILEGALVVATCLRASWLGRASEALDERASRPDPFASALPDEELSSKNPPAAAPR